MSLSIGVHISKRLTASPELQKLVGDRVFPISTKSETSFPFVIYKRGSLETNSTKDGYNLGDKVTAEIVVLDENYSSTVEIAEAIRAALERKKGEYDRFNVIGAKLISADEDFIEDTFVQRLTFLFETDY